MMVCRLLVHKTRMTCLSICAGSQLFNSSFVASLLFTVFFVCFFCRSIRILASLDQYNAPTQYTAVKRNCRSQLQDHLNNKCNFNPITCRWCGTTHPQWRRQLFIHNNIENLTVLLKSHYYNSCTYSRLESPTNHTIPKHTDSHSEGVWDGTRLLPQWVWGEVT